MLLNKFSSPQEVKEFYHGIDPRGAMMAHITRFYPTEPIGSGLTQFTLERIINTLVTKAMEAL